ncbi:hypothetical protein [Geminocystis sp.]|uniref:hypothetical protein n=1 Tax=Geminocystis sp. TaxID=2664100 RepID=UPI0035935B4F
MIEPLTTSKLLYKLDRTLPQKTIEPLTISKLPHKLDRTLHQSTLIHKHDRTFKYININS